MPTYEYRCDRCDRNFDVVQSFHDEPLTACPTCESPVRRVFGSVGIVFKGSGFYKTDSRTATASKSRDGDSGSGATSDGGGTEGAGSDGGTTSGGSGGTKEGSGDASPASTVSRSEPAAPAGSPKANGQSSSSKESTKT